MTRSRVAMGPMASTGLSNKLLNSSAVSVLALLVSIAAGLYLLPFLITHLGDHWYGTWVFLGSLFFYFTILDFGLFSASERFVTYALAKEDTQEANSILSTCLLLYGLAGLIALAAGLLAVLLAPSFVPDASSLGTIRWAMLVLAIDVALFFPGSLLNGIIVARIRYDLAGLVQILKIALRTGLIIFFITQGYSIVAIAVIQLVTNLLERCLKAWMAFRLFPALSLSVKLASRDRTWQLARYGIHSFLAELADKVRFHTDILVTGAFLAASSVTLYNIAVRIVHYYAQGLASAINVLFPVFIADAAEEAMDALRQRFLFATRLAVVGATVSAGLLLLLAEPFIRIWVGDEYVSSAVPLTILLVGILVELSLGPASLVLFALARHRFIAQIGLVEAGANLALSIALVGPFGLVGVALGTTVPLILLRGLGLPVYVCRQVDLALGQFLRSLATPLLLALGLQVPVHLVFSFGPELGFIGLLPLAVVSYAVVTGLVIRFGLTAEERRSIWSALRSWRPLSALRG